MKCRYITNDRYGSVVLATSAFVYIAVCVLGSVGIASSISTRLGADEGRGTEWIRVDRLFTGGYETPGMYIIPNANTAVAGLALELFPDGTAIADEYSDIGRSETVATGKWSEENGCIEIRWELFSRNAVLVDNLRRIPSKMVLFGKLDPKGSASFILVPQGEFPREGVEYPFRTAAYFDWLARKQELERQIRDEPKGQS